MEGKTDVSHPFVTNFIKRKSPFKSLKAYAWIYRDVRLQKKIKACIVHVLVNSCVKIVKTCQVFQVKPIKGRAGGRGLLLHKILDSCSIIEYFE